MKKILLFLSIFLALTVSLIFLWFHRMADRVLVTPVKHTKDATLPATLAEYFSTHTPFSIAVMGYGGGNHEGAYLTDTIIVAHIQPKKRSIHLLSIPRDLWVSLPTDIQGSSDWKINAAYAIGIDDRNYPNKPTQYQGKQGGGAMAKYALSMVTGLNIPYFVAIDFSGFTKTIDTLGGVDITVSPAFTATQYPIVGKEKDLCGHTEEEIPDLDAYGATTSAELAYPCRYETLNFDAGLQHMDGETALKYVRSRHSKQDGSDFARAKRQQNLLLAAKEKILSVGFLPRVIPFIDSLGYNFKTDLTLDDIRTLISNADDLNGYTVQTIALTDDNYLIQTRSDNGQLILSSIDGIGSWESIHEYLSLTLSGKTVPAIPVVLVQNGTKTPGLAYHAAEALQKLKFRILEPESADVLAEKTSVVIYDKTIKTSYVDALQKEFGKASVTYGIKQDQQDQDHTILVIVGSDYTPRLTTTPKQ